MAIKKTFILYLDNLNVLDDLTDEEAGQLFKAIKQYQIERKTDLKGLMKAIFTPFQTVLDKDDVKYEQTCEQRRLAGAKGGRKKVENLANLANAKFAKKNVANLADNDNDNENDNDINYPPISPQRGKVVVEENLLEPKTKIDPFTNPLIDECIELYQTHCPDLCKLTGYERKDSNMRQLIAEHLALIDCDIGAFKRLCISANEVKTIANKTIDLKQMITCYIGILNGKYKEVTTNSVAPNFGSELARITAKFSQLEKEKNNDRGLQPVPE